MTGIRRLLAVLCRHFAPRSKNQVLDTESQPILSIQEFSSKDSHTSQRLVANRKVCLETTLWLRRTIPTSALRWRKAWVSGESKERSQPKVRKIAPEIGALS